MEPNLSNLPDAAQRLVGIVGLATTLLLVDKLGGQSFRLYASGESITRIASVIGPQGAGELLEHFGSDEFEIPLCAAVLRTARNARIHAEFDEMTSAGRSARDAVHQLAIQHGPMRERTVWRILKKSSAPSIPKPRKPVDPRQMGLF